MNKIFLWAFLMFCSVSNVFSYELTVADEEIITNFEQKIFSALDKQWTDVAGQVLDRIEWIQNREVSERISKILMRISANIDERYVIWEYIVAFKSTPVLYTSDFKTQFGWDDGQTLNFDDYGEIDALELVALTGTVFQLQKDLGNGIYQVSTKDYPVDNELYIHKEFVWNISRAEPEARVKSLPSREEIINRLTYMEWKDYVWGGNDPDGIPELLKLYAPSWEISTLKREQWQLEWVDCSGLIYWATDGYTPRNTSWLVEYGTPLDIEWKSLEEITPLLEPLDIIVWKGHMLVVYDETHTIESTVSPNGDLAPGVQIREMSDSLAEVLQERTPTNNYNSSTAEKPFVIIRWIK